MNGTRVYLPGLHGLRFLAAAAVVVHHFEQFKKSAGLPHMFRQPWVFGLGGAAVTWFFALSGFLITYLLMTEAETTGDVSVLRFYARRALRIWPLYFAVAAVGLFLLPVLLPYTQRPPYWSDPEPARVAAYVFFAPNVAFALWGPHRWVSHLWSIGTEEQFYLIWAPLFRACRRYLVPVCVAIVVGLVTLRAWFPDDGESPRIGKFLTQFRIDAMAVGAIGAWLAHRRTAIAAILTNPRSVCVAVAVTIILPIYTHDAPASIHVAQAIAFTALAIGVSGLSNCPFILENRATRFLGDVSYGIYMLHPFVCFAVIRLMKPHWELLTPGISSAIGHVIALGVTTALAGLSYVAFERPILRWKKRFTVIASGTDVAPSAQATPEVRISECGRG